MPFKKIMKTSVVYTMTDSMFAGLCEIRETLSNITTSLFPTTPGPPRTILARDNWLCPANSTIARMKMKRKLKQTIVLKLFYSILSHKFSSKNGVGIFENSF